MGRLVLIDGESYAPEDARVSVYDRGFLYGDSVFETIRTYGSKLYALDEHMRRLQRSADEVGIDMPISQGAMADETRRAVRDAGNRDSYARVMLTRGSGPVGLDTTLAAHPLRVILVEPLSMPPARHYREGLSAICVQTVRAADVAGSAKVGNYLASALALRQARDAGASEALVVNRDGLVVEGTTSNVFAAVGGVLITPPIDQGVLEGITRARVIELAGELGIEVRLEAMTPAAMHTADEIFLTSSIRELMPIVALDGKQIADGRPGPLTRRLHRAFRRRVGMDDTVPWEEE